MRVVKPPPLPLTGTVRPIIFFTNYGCIMMKTLHILRCFGRKMVPTTDVDLGYLPWPNTLRQHFLFKHKFPPLSALQKYRIRPAARAIRVMMLYDMSFKGHETEIRLCTQ